MMTKYTFYATVKKICRESGELFNGGKDRIAIKCAKDADYPGRHEIVLLVDEMITGEELVMMLDGDDFDLPLSFGIKLKDAKKMHTFLSGYLKDK